MTPYQANVIASYLQSTGLCINQDHAALMGASSSNGDYTPGTILTDTGLDVWQDVTVLAKQRVTELTLTPTVFNNLLATGTIPALTNFLPSSYTGSNPTPEYGFLRILAKQAHDEFHHGGGSYADFLSSFQRCASYMAMTNGVIDGLTSAKTHLSGFYSNSNDFISGDVLGVNRATVFFGQDLIKCGKAIDLSQIATFGSPVALLRTMNTHNALGEPLLNSLEQHGFEPSELTQLLSGQTPTELQEFRVYSSFTSVTSDDLEDCLTPLNFQHSVDSLADLLNPMKLFPASFQSLTVPNYAVQTPNGGSKTYQLIYVGNDCNPVLYQRGFDLQPGVPDNIATACAAFSYSMRQITNIASTEVEKFAQVVMNLETMGELAVDSGNSPGNNQLIDSALSSVGDSLTMNHYFGAMSGIPYDLATIKEQLTQLVTPAVLVKMSDILDLLTAPLVLPALTYDVELQALIDELDTIIETIGTEFPQDVSALNTLWETVGHQLVKEQSARTEALPSPSVGSKLDIYSFGYALPSFSTDIGEGMTAQTLEKISDLSIVGGQSCVAAMRESRNSARLALAGIPTNTHSDETGPDSGLTLDQFSPTAPAPNVININGTSVVLATGAAIVKGSFAGSPYTNLVPQNLSILNTTMLINSQETPSQAAAEVIRCNCDC